MRNELSAHNLRSRKNGNRFIFSQNEISYNAPRNFADLLLISNLLTLITQAIAKEFETESKTFKFNSQEAVKDIARYNTKEDVSKVTINLMYNVNAALKKEGRQYILETTNPFAWDQI